MSRVRARALTHAQRPVCAGAGMPCCHTKCGSQLHGTDAMLISPLAWGVAICAVYGVRYDVSPARPTRVAGVELGIVYQYTYASRSLLNFFFFVCQVERGRQLVWTTTAGAQSSDPRNEEAWSLMLPWATRARSFHLPFALRRVPGCSVSSIENRESTVRLRWDAKHGTLVEHEVEHETITLLGLPCSSSRAPRALRPWRHTSIT